MLLTPISVEQYEDVYAFLTNVSLQRDEIERRAAFDKHYPIDPVIDLIPDGETSPDLYERVERHVDDHGNGSILVTLLGELEGNYLLDVRANAHETCYVVTRVS